MEDQGKWAERRKQTAARQRQSEWQATAWGCLGSGCSDPLTFTEWPIAPCLSPLEKFKRTQIHRGNAKACGLPRSLISLQASPPSLYVTAVTLAVCMSVWVRVCPLPVNTSTKKDGFPARFEDTGSDRFLFACVGSWGVLSCPHSAVVAWQTDRLGRRGVETQGGGRAAEMSLIRDEQFFAQQGSFLPPS